MPLPVQVSLFQVMVVIFIIVVSNQMKTTGCFGFLKLYIILCIAKFGESVVKYRLIMRYVATNE